jgi:hypothetical protein
MARPAMKEPVGDLDWAGAVAQTALDQDEAARQRREDAEVGAARLHARVKADGRAWFQRVEADFRSAAAAFNARIGRPLVTLLFSPSGQILASAQSLNGAGWVSVVPLLSTDPDAVAPGAIVTERWHGRESGTPFDFELLEGDDLRLRGAGASLSPEAFARTIFAPWLASIPLGGR